VLYLGLWLMFSLRVAGRAVPWWRQKPGSAAKEPLYRALFTVAGLPY